METIVFLERDTLRASLRRPSFEHVWRDYGATRPEEVLERLEGATVAVVNKLPLRADVLERLPSLRLIAVAATGTDNIDLDFCKGRGVGVTNVRGYARETLPEHVLMLALALRRNLVAYREAVRAGAWAGAPQFCLHGREIHDLHGSTLGLMGYGTLGRGVERLARAFGMEVLISERKGAAELREGRTAFDEVLRRADVLSLHVPLGDETRHLIGRDEFSRMKPTAILINTSRGFCVDEVSLVEALQQGRIAGAALDVFAEEPLPAGHPLTRLDNVVLTPHLGWPADLTYAEFATACADEILSYLRGDYANVVNPEALTHRLRPRNVLGRYAEPGVRADDRRR